MNFTSQEIEDIRNCSFRAVDFIEKFFYQGWGNTSKTVNLTDSQIDAIDSIQFGYPVNKFKHEEVGTPPRGVVMVWPRQTGKSYACAYAAASLIIIMKNCQIGIISATDEQSKKLMRKIVKVLRNSIFWDYVIKQTKRQNFIELTNGNYIECWPCTDGIEGSTYTFLFADEAALMDEQILLSSAMPCVTHGKRWIMLSTPKGNKGIFIQRYYDGVKSRPIICKKCGTRYPQSAFPLVDDFPLDDSEMPIEDMPPCVECGAKDYKSGIGKFTVPWVDPWNDGVRTKEKIKQLLDEHDWSPEAQEAYLGKILTEGSSVFLRQWLDNCTNEELKNVKKRIPGVTYVIGADYGKKKDASSFYVTHMKKDGTIITDFGLTIAGEFDYEKEYSQIAADLLALIAYYNPVWIVPDATGLGDPLVEMLELDLKALKQRRQVEITDLLGKKRIIKTKEKIRTSIYNNRGNFLQDKLDPKSATKGFIISMKSKPGLIGNLIKLFSTGKIEIPPKTEPESSNLREELLRFESEWKVGTNYTKYGTQSFHDDRVIALALSAWGHRNKPWNIDKINLLGGSFEMKGGDYEFGETGEEGFLTNSYLF